jgi:hypothetical protein
MNSDNFFIRFIVNALVGGLLGAITIGALGLLLAGFQGVLNGLIFGGVIGMVGGFASISTIENTVSRYGQHRHSKIDDL